MLSPFRFISQYFSIVSGDRRGILLFTSDRTIGTSIVNDSTVECLERACSILRVLEIEV